MTRVEMVIRRAREGLRERGKVMRDLCDALGVPASKQNAVRSYGALGGVFGVLPIQHQRTVFDTVEGRQLTAILAAYDRLDELPVDLVAVRLDEPQNAYRLLGVAHALGQPEIDYARFCSLPTLNPEPAALTVHASALDWLRGGCEGCAILDHKRAPRILSDIDEVVASPAAFAPGLHNLLHQHPPHLPRVMVPEYESIAA